MQIQGGQEMLSVFIDSPGGIPGGAAEIEAMLRRFAQTSVTCGEAMMQARQFFEGAAAVKRDSLSVPKYQSVFRHKVNIESLRYCLSTKPGEDL